MFGAGKGHRVVFYITVGTGIGGALIYEGKIYTGAHGVASEIGHLRPGPEASQPEADLESIAAGWGIAAQAAALVKDIISNRNKGLLSDDDLRSYPLRWVLAEAPDLISPEELHQAAESLLLRCGNDLSRLTTKLLGEALAEGNLVAKLVFRQAIGTLGWAIAQMITLLAPSAVVIGGGVSLLGERLFFEPLRQQVERYVFPPLKDQYIICSASLGEEVMIHGATLLARKAFESTPDLVV
jgi:glucokinase